MSHVNGNDIDDLFRRASEKYPLKIGTGDWPGVAADLEKDPSLVLPPVSDEGERRRRKRFLWLLLLLPLGGLGYLTFNGGVRQTTIAKESNTHNVATTASGGNATTPNEGPASPKESVNVANTNKGTLTPDKAAVTPNTGAVAPKGSATGNMTTPGSRASLRNDGTAAKGTAAGKTTGRGTEARKIAADETVGLETAAGESASGNNTAKQYTNKKDAAVHSSVPGQETVAGNGYTTRAVKGNNSFEKEGDLVAAGDPDPRYAGLITQRAAVGGGVALNVKVQGRPAQTVTSAAKKDLTKLSQPKQTHFYAGLLAAPDLSTVKMQSVKAIGTTFSLLAGYNINSRWAIETGLSLDRKKYYSSGEYFSTKKIPLPTGVEIANVDGICNMWEIPLNVRYNFGQTQKMHWFATAGFSTYLMTKEHYSYVLEYVSGGSGWPYQKTYPTNSNYLFSIFNLSVGYEQKLGNIGNLRLEPYLRVPLAGLGTGNLPILSAGLNVGITRRIW